MRKRVFSVVLALCLCTSSQSVAYAFQEDLTQQKETLAEEIIDEGIVEEDSSQKEDDLTKEPSGTTDAGGEEKYLPPEEPEQHEDSLSQEEPDKMDADQWEKQPLQERASRESVRENMDLTPAGVYDAMIALQDQDGYREGTPWTNEEPYSDEAGYYRWNGGPLGGVNISAVGCVAFAFILSDEAFGTLQARMYAEGEFSFEDIKVGDILRVNNDAHTVIVLEALEDAVVVAEGNISSGDHKGKVHWGRVISKSEVMRNTSHYITRYPENYIPPDDTDANEIIAGGTLDTGLLWNLTRAGTLTISGQGAMPDFGAVADQPWSDNSAQIRRVVLGEGVANIGSGAFWNCGVINVEISSTVTIIGNNAFRGSKLNSVTIPSGVKTIGDSAFYACQELSSVTVCEGVETINQSAFTACTRLYSIDLPASIGEVGAAAFFQCQALELVKFAPGSKQVKMGDDMFAQCYWLRGVTLPKAIDRISNRMFQNCRMLAGVEIPQGVGMIGESAFGSCVNLVVVVIPDSVTDINAGAFSDCHLEDVYFTGTETQWSNIWKGADTITAVADATFHYNYVPSDTNPDPPANPDDGEDNTGGDKDDNTGGDKPGNDTGNASGDKVGNNMGFDNDAVKSYTDKASSSVDSGIATDVETWKPITLEEKKRYDCMGKEAVRYIPSKDNDFQITVENAMQGFMCFKSFEAVLEDYTIGRTYNIYALSDNIYSTDKEIQVTIKIPSAIFKENREYKMICVTEGGQPFIYNDLDKDPETVTIKTNKFYAYALIYR